MSQGRHAGPLSVVAVGHRLLAGTGDTAELTAAAQRAPVTVDVRHDDGRRRGGGVLAAAQPERLQEHSPELLTDGAVQDEVDGTVDVHEQVASVRQDDVPGRRLHVRRVHRVRHVVRQRRHLNPIQSNPHGPALTQLKVTSGETLM